MRELLVLVSEYVITAIDALALVLIAVGSLEAFWQTVRVMLLADSGHLRREVWLRYARWLVAALTFQLATDIVESAISTSWESVGRLAAIAVVRTFLNYFLERDLTEIRERRHSTASANEPRARETGNDPSSPFPYGPIPSHGFRLRT